MTDKPLNTGATSTWRPALMRRAAPLSLLLGALSAIGFAPFEAWPLTLACLAAWLWLVHESTDIRRALWRGWLFGLGQFAIGLNWLQHPFAFQDAMPHWLGYVGVALVSAYLALYPMLAAGLAWRLASPRSIGDGATPAGAPFVLVAGAGWTISEWLRGTIFAGFPWNPLGVVLVPTPIAAMASLIGTYALSGMTVLLAGALLIATQRRWRFPVAVLGVTLLLILAGGIGSGDVRRATSASDPVVRIIQPNLGEEERPTPEYPENNLRALEALAGKPGAAPRLVVWPEGALRYAIEDGYPAYYYWPTSAPAVRRRIAAKLGARDVLLAGSEGFQFDDQGDLKTATNSIFALDGRGRILARYDKAHLVPFGEYLPMRPVLTAIGLSRLVPGEADFEEGPGPRTIALPGFGAIGMQICYEIIFSGAVIDPARRPALVFNPSNDSWFGTWGPPQHLAQARLRAIEEGVPIIRSTPTGISAVIAADGRLLDSVPLRRAGAIETRLPPARAPTLFARAGNWMAFLTVAAMLLIAVAIRRGAR